MIKKSVSRCTGVCITAILLTVIARAGESDKQGPQGGHVHGNARLNIATGGRLVHIELFSQAVNLVGFEHARYSEAEQVARCRSTCSH